MASEDFHQIESPHHSGPSDGHFYKVKMGLLDTQAKVTAHCFSLHFSQFTHFFSKLTQALDRHIFGISFFFAPLGNVLPSWPT